jgi:hypothetical protein
MAYSALTWYCGCSQPLQSNSPEGKEIIQLIVICWCAGIILIQSLAGHDDWFLV